MASDGLHLNARAIVTLAILHVSRLLFACLILFFFLFFNSSRRRASSWALALPALISRVLVSMIFSSLDPGMLRGRLWEMVNSSWFDSNQLLALSPKLEVGQDKHGRLPSFSTAPGASLNLSGHPLQPPWASAKRGGESAQTTVTHHMVCNARLGSLPNELGINKIGLAASKAALACVKPPPGTLSSQVG